VKLHRYRHSPPKRLGKLARASGLVTLFPGKGEGKAHQHQLDLVLGGHPREGVKTGVAVRTLDRLQRRRQRAGRVRERAAAAGLAVI